MSPGSYVSVVGSGTVTGELYEKAREVGRLVAARGGTVVCGGRSGVMEAAARGAAEAGGVAIGILPDEDRELANEFLSYSIATGTGHAREEEYGYYCDERQGQEHEDGEEEQQPRGRGSRL